MTDKELKCAARIRQFFTDHTYVHHRSSPMGGACAGDMTVELTVAPESVDQEVAALVREEFPSEPDGLDQVMELLRRLTEIFEVSAHLTLHTDGSGSVGTGLCAVDGFYFGTLAELRDKIHESAERTKQETQQEADIKCVQYVLHHYGLGVREAAAQEAFARICKTVEATTP